MKTAKLILVAAIMAFASVGIAQPKTTLLKAEKPPIFKSALIPLRVAMADRGLVQAMRAQLNPSFLLDEKPSYTVAVRYKHDVYYIYGTYSDWKNFFGIRERNPLLKD